ncbi:MAG: ACP S-malonyltransferase [Clostridiales bacterium]|nr:ACP S-malonyltransferase [Clostridiales bacterium]
MKLAFLYAGQGSQKVGMGRDFYEKFPMIRSSFDNENAGFDIRNLCFETPLDILSRTRYTQPCMAALATAVTKLLYEEGIYPTCAAGLSLGEYSALYASGVFDEDTLISLLAFRGKVMEETTANIKSKMCAVFNLSEELIQEAISEINALNLGIVACANFNCPGQIVIGGEAEAVDAAAEKCLKMGAKRCLPVNVSGPFHTPLMEEASKLLGERLYQTEFRDMHFSVVFNTTADVLGEGETIPHILQNQVKSPVLFEKTIYKLRSLGVDTVIEIGPGRVLSGFVRKTAPDIVSYSIEDVDSFYKTVKAVKGA